MDSKGYPLDSFNTVFNMLVLLFPLSFPKWLMDSKGYQVPFNTVFSPAYQSLFFVHKGITTVKDVLLTPFNTAFHPACQSLPFMSKGLMDSKECPMDSF